MREIQIHQVFTVKGSSTPPPLMRKHALGMITSLVVHHSLLCSQCHGSRRRSCPGVSQALGADICDMCMT